MSRIVEVAAVQLDAVPGAVERNLARFAELVHDGATGADLVVAPELMPTGYDLDLLAARGGELAEPLDGTTATLAAEHAFPDVATALALEGAELLIIPSAVPYGYEHLLTLRTRARAQDNQLHAVAANLAGEVFCGGSLIVGPRRDVLAQAGTDDEVVRATIDLDEIAREREPALALRRPELYISDEPSRLEPR
jgi:predicted amidohydrolase